MEAKQLLWTMFLLTLLLGEDGLCGRTWQFNVNYNNSRNWNVDRVPCAADRIVLQDSQSVVLELSEGTTSLQALVLAAYTEVLLPKDGTLQITGRKYTANCDGQDAVFKPTQALRWTDAHSWDGWNSATPDIERIPCASDAVIFPPGATYKVLMPDFVRVGSLQIGGTSMMDSLEWFEFSNNNEGTRQFFKADNEAADVEISGNPCPLSQWCECGNEYLHSQVCTKTCPVPLCKQPIQPSGFCCPICGAYFLLGGKSQDRQQLTEHISSRSLQDKGVLWHASEVRGLVQVVLVEDGEYSGEVADIAKHLKTSIINSGNGWTAREFHVSGHAWFPTTFGQIIGHFFSFLVFAALILAAVIVFYSQNWSYMQFMPSENRPFVFARFENQSSEVIVASEQPVRSLTPALPQAFDNPMYGATSQEQRDNTEQPVYTELEETENQEPAKKRIVLESTNFS